MTTELVRMVPEMRRCALYRHYDVVDVLLYVGISETLVDRTNNGHARTSEWVQYAVRAEAAWYDSRDSAAEAERLAIRDEVPIFNRQHAVGDIDARIANYVREREIDALKSALGTYELIVGKFLKVVPTKLIEETTEAAEHDYQCAGRSLDVEFMGHILRHVTDRFGRLMEQLRDQAYVEAYEVALEGVRAELEEIRRLGWRRTPPPNTEEPPF